MSKNPDLDDEIVTCPLCGSVGEFVENRYINEYIGRKDVYECSEEICGILEFFI